ncbi:MAG: conjugal transfer protein TraG [Desulfobacterales bacterium CG23_combo_of_CG06-09_8_20_14_all_51_8]|nr:MAG: conjugal transfer protein TraG [Desulfobacterales bacterium CG23_combo_of_CG06-09_8_20_14_all_51_8]
MFKNNRKTYLGHGYNLQTPAKVNKISLPDADRKGHLFGFGSTRIGKTRLIELMMEQDIRKGYSLVFFDPKGDIDIFSKIVQIAYEENRQDELCLVTPIFPDCSAKMDPLAYYYMPEELVSHVVSGIKAKEEFFINIAYETTFVIILSLLFFARIKNERPNLNFNSVKERASYTDLKNLEAQLKDYEDDPEAEEILASLRQILASPQDYFSKVSSSLRTVLTSLSAGSVGAIIGKAKVNNFIKRLEQGKRVILIVQTGSLLTRKTAHIVARVLLSMIQSFVGRIYLSGRTITPPLCVYMDEASNLLYMGVEDLFNKAGGAGVWIHAFTQSIADIEAELGPASARKILDNTNSKIFMRVNDPNTANYISEYSGMVKRFSPILSLGGGITVREVEEPLVRPENVLNLQLRDFYLFTFEGAFKGKAGFVKEPYLKVMYPRVEVL